MCAKNKVLQVSLVKLYLLFNITKVETCRATIELEQLLN